jgi:uncharacterized C2H2 Zn-finger protein
MGESVWLDISIVRCPRCGRLYADASWYVSVMESDLECGSCGSTFNSSRNVVDRFLLRMLVENDVVVRFEREEISD